ncbi:MAG: hypothetical protein VW080_03650 [Flavobacteriaceae bacterium]
MSNTKGSVGEELELLPLGPVLPGPSFVSSGEHASSMGIPNVANTNGLQAVFKKFLRFSIEYKSNNV